MNSMNFQPWQHHNSSTENQDIHNNSTTNSLPKTNQPIATNSFHSFNNRLNQFNEDVSRAVLALVQVKPHPQHELLHELIQLRISKNSQQKTIRQQNQVLNDIESQRQLILNNNLPIEKPLQISPLPAYPQLIVPQSVPQTVPQSVPQAIPLPQTQPPQPTETPLLDRHGKVLNNTKRAAQNRNAQKLFRLRRVQYVKELEAEVIELKQLKSTINSLREENLQLRDYILSLQSKILENNQMKSENDLDSNSIPLSRFDSDFQNLNDKDKLK